MHTYVINLDRSPERLETFRRTNNHLPNIHRFSAVDGSTIDRAGLIEQGIVSSELQYSNGALGCALSHLFFWEAAVSQRETITVVEDDAVLHRRFAEHSHELTSRLPPTWDIVVWGWNFDSILMLDLLPGISPCVSMFDQAGLRQHVDAYQELPFQPSAFRLLRCFGTVGYTITPAGASKLKDLALPLATFEIPIPMISPKFPNTGIDVVMNRAYPQLEAFVSLPPLAVTRNEHATSTVLGSGR